MLWTNEDIAKLRRILDEHKSKSVIEITRMMGRGYNVDDVSGVCGAIFSNGDNDMNAKRIDPVEFWRLVDEGMSTRDIAKHFGVQQTSVCHKISKGRPKAAVLNAADKNKENNDMKWTPEQVAQLLNMKAEGFSNAEIAEAIGFPAQTVHNKISDLKKLNGGVLPTKYTGKRKYTVADVTPYKPDASDEDGESTDTPTVTHNVTPTDTPTDTPTERPCPMPENKAEAVETVTDEAPTVREPKPMDIVDLAYKAKFMAIDLGFTPDHLIVELRNVRDDISISGKDADGKVYEIRFSVTDPAKFPKGDTCPTNIPLIG